MTDVAPEEFGTRIAEAYKSDGPAVSLGRGMIAGQVIPNATVQLPAAMCNRHGLIAGATGTGKTKTLQLMAEQLSAHGRSGLRRRREGRPLRPPEAGCGRRRASPRAPTELGIEWTPAGHPVTFLSLGGHGPGVPVRATISSFGPQLLAKVMGANETQSSSLILVFDFADKAGPRAARPRRPARRAPVPHERRRPGRPRRHRRVVVGDRGRPPAQDRRARASRRGGVLRRARARQRRSDPHHGRRRRRHPLPRARRSAGQTEVVLDVPDVAARRPVPDAARDRRHRQAQALLLLRRSAPACSRTRRRRS